MNTKDLIGVALDWSVAKALGIPVEFVGYATGNFVLVDKELYEMQADDYIFAPSTNADQGYRIIQRQSVATWANGFGWNAAHPKHADGGTYDPSLGLLDVECYDGSHGSTPLIAAMRAVVKCYIGSSVFLPDILEP